MTTKLNLVINQGADFNSVFALTTANGQVIDLTSYTGASKLRKNYTTSNAVSFDVTLSSNGYITLSMDSTTTANIVSGRYVYDVIITSSTNVVSRVLEGIVDVSPDVTR